MTISDVILLGCLLCCCCCALNSLQGSIQFLSAYIQQEAHYVSLPTQCSLMESSARFGLPVDIDARLDQQSIESG